MASGSFRLKSHRDVAQKRKRCNRPGRKLGQLLGHADAEERGEEREVG